MCCRYWCDLSVLGIGTVLKDRAGVPMVRGEFPNLFSLVLFLIREHVFQDLLEQSAHILRVLV